MKALLVAAVIGSALIAGGVLMAGDLGIVRVASPQSTDTSGAIQQAAATDRTVTLQVDNMYCASCPYIVKRSLAGVPGVKDVSVSFRDKTAVVTFDSTQTDVAALSDATLESGYPSKVRDQ